MKKYIYGVALLLVIGMCAAPLWAQQLEGTIRGVAKDSAGKPIVGATIRLYDPETGRKYEAKTNAKGEYQVIVYMGTYDVSLLQNNNLIDEHKNAPVNAGGEQVVDFNEQPTGGPTPEQLQKIAEEQKQNEKIKGLNASLAQAKELEGAGNYDQAVTILQQATQTDPSQDLIWAYLGDAQRGAAAKATDPQARTKGYQDAIESYQKALAIKPNNGPYLAQLADAYAKSGQTEKAVQEYAAAAQADPPNAAAYYYNEGAVLTNINKTDEAIAAFDKSIELDPKRAAAYYWKGINLIGKATTKDNKIVAPPGTAEAFNKYLELEPNGKYAEGAKQMLASIGATVETSYGKGKSKK